MVFYKGKSNGRSPQWGVAQAEEYTFGLRDACRDIAGSRKRGRLLEGIQANYLALAFNSHFIIYKATGASVTIVRILHRRMNIAANL